MRLEQLPIGTKVKVYFREKDQRMPMIGIFVQLQDSTMLAKRGMVRFVNQSRLDFWKADEPQMNLTKIYVATDFLTFKPVTV